ncbi:uncharacterized protein LOC119641015 [Glossina fuscipes]|uniref:Uncharacterized protein LOC119641015 n=1 Tax=Glossina fuscipes TaxID=7396 RepID=A0A9C5Z9A1_9MUSC|nr:uncharacterized protein LOC119641015 [Glossina fuscipes]KAI9578138.1 hypothetical protein GQX74_014032 [Glossina fuscipes]
MSPNMQNNVLELKHLLSEWKIEYLLPHLSAQRVNIEVLEMMKESHIKLLLHSYPIGDQIRFEYNLEKWRLDIGKPLIFNKTEEINATTPPSESKAKHWETNAIQDIEMPIKLNKDGDIRNIKEEQSYDPLAGPLNTSNLVILPSSYAAKSSKPMPYTTKAHGPIPKVNIKEILLSCKPAGPELIKIYRTQKFFTKSERARLISTIVSYYLDNEIHLNLQTSYALEKEILKMFPTETLDMYRQAKRGKIYMRYGSAKWIYSKHKRLADEAVKKMQDREEKQNSDNNPDISSEEGEQTSTVITENAGFDLKKYKLRSVTNNENAEIKNDDKRIHVIQDVLLQNIQNDIKH